MSFKLKEFDDKVMISTVLDKGTEITINGLEVILEENVHFLIKNATTVDQAAEICSIQHVPVDLSHFDHEKGVHVRYDMHGTRYETKPAVTEEVVEEKTPKAKAKK